jgi:DNA-binding response OmpR family regulator
MDPMATILVVDDQPEILENIELILSVEGYNVLAAADGPQALDLLQAHAVDLILADIAMPRMNGYQLFERVRENPHWLPIPFLFLSARAMDSDIRYGKELGADDYLTKPIQPEDLLAAVQGRLRRARELARLSEAHLASKAPEAEVAATPAPQVLDLGRLRIDPTQHRAWMDGQPLKLSAREFLLLTYLAERVDQVVSAQELIQVTHELDTDRVEAGSLLRPLVRSLRRKLGYAVGEMGCIENVRGVGYRLSVPDDA